MACEQVDYEVQSSSGDEDKGERGKDGGQAWSEGQGESGEESSEDEEAERQRNLAVAEKEKVILHACTVHVHVGGKCESAST